MAFVFVSYLIDNTGELSYALTVKRRSYMAEEQVHGHGNMKKMAGLAAISAVAGAVTAMILTPKSGRELRDKMKDKAEEVGGKAKEKLDEIK